MSDIVLTADTKSNPVMVHVNGRSVDYKLTNDGIVRIEDVERFAEHGRAAALWPDGNKTSYDF